MAHSQTLPTFQVSYSINIFNERMNESTCLYDCCPLISNLLVFRLRALCILDITTPPHSHCLLTLNLLNYINKINTNIIIL